MTRRSKRDLDRGLNALESTSPGEPVSFAEYYEYYNYCIEVHGSLSAGPSPEEFFGHELAESDSINYWKRMIRVWDGEEDPPCSPNEWEWWPP